MCQSSRGARRRLQSGRSVAARKLALQSFAAFQLRVVLGTTPTNWSKQAEGGKPKWRLAINCAVGMSPKCSRA